MDSCPPDKLHHRLEIMHADQHPAASTRPAAPPNMESVLSVRLTRPAPSCEPTHARQSVALVGGPAGVASRVGTRGLYLGVNKYIQSIVVEIWGILQAAHGFGRWWGVGKAEGAYGQCCSGMYVES